MAIADVAAPLGQGFHALAPGDLAAVVTALEMRAPPPSLKRLVPEADVPLQLVRWKVPDPAKYRMLFRRVGGRWLWWSRLALDDAGLAAIIQNAEVELYAVADRAGVEVGMLELDFRKGGEAEIAFLGLIPGAIGKGFGKWLMRRALQLAWGRKDMARVWVHTCTLDGPQALPFYIGQGFVPYARFVEVFPDPRAAGLLDGEAPYVPIL
jgi:GNAT superfamily N-acetyltransferase